MPKSTNARRHPLAVRQTAEASLSIGRFKTGVSISVTPAGLLAAGAVTAAILCAIAPIVRAARIRPGA